MLKNIILFLVVILSTTFSINCIASTSDLNEVKIPVGNYTSANKEEALKEGLRQVIVKVSANSSVLEEETVKSAFNNVDKYVSKYLYLKSEGELYLNIEYNLAKIKQLLKSNNLALPIAKRPTIILWVAIDDDRDIKILGNSSFSDIEKQLLTTSNKFGLPVVLPMLDLSEQLSITAYDLISFDFDKVIASSKNYEADSILIGSVFKFNGEWNYRWKLKHNGVESTWFDSKSNLNAGFDNLLASLRDKILTKPKKQKVLKVGSLPGVLKLSISGVDSLDQYTAVEDYLQKKFLSKVNGKIELMELADKVAVFKIDTDADKKAVLNILNQDKFLTEDKDSLDVAPDTLGFKIDL